MDNHEKARRSKALNRLFASLLYTGKADPVDVRDAYVIALAGICTAALEKSVEQFCTVGVEGHNGINVPTTAQLVGNAAKWQSTLFPRYKELAKPEDRVISKEERARVSKLFSEHVARMEASRDARRAEPLRRRPTDAEGLGDPRPMHVRLGRMAQLDHKEVAE